MNERKPADVAEEIAALLAQSEEAEHIDTGEAVRLLEDARDTLRAVGKKRGPVLLGYLGLDQCGGRYVMNGVKHPRAELLRRLGRTKAEVMYVDRKNGPPRKTGWVIAGLWISVYRVYGLED